MIRHLDVTVKKNAQPSEIILLQSTDALERSTCTVLYYFGVQRSLVSWVKHRPASEIGNIILLTLVARIIIPLRERWIFFSMHLTSGSAVLECKMPSWQLSEREISISWDGLFGLIFLVVLFPCACVPELPATNFYLQLCFLIYFELIFVLQH